MQTNPAISPYVSQFEDFFNSKCKNDILKLAEVFPEKKSVFVDYSVLGSYDPELADALFDKPDSITRAAREAIIQMNITSPQGTLFTPHIRFQNLPQEQVFALREINSENINKFFGVSGVVTRVAKLYQKIVDAFFECKNCGKIYTIKQDDQSGKLIEPNVCTCERRNFQLLLEQCTFMDVQRAEIQEPLEILRGGEDAKKIKLWIEDDLSNQIIPGDKVEITGTLRLEPPKFKGSIYDKYVDCNTIKKVEKEFEEIELSEEDRKGIIELSNDPKIFEKMVGSIAPSIYGHSEIKEAIALQLFGGTPNKKKPDGLKIRPDMHILLIGDPGTSKTQLLRYVRDLAPKGIYISGKSSTAAGVTASAERDDLSEGGWTLKAGALVLASGGLACIDEFDKMDDEDRSSMHEAMENATISIAKAGMVATFRANTSILAAANPKYGRFDEYDLPAEQFDIPVTLLSRFDLIFPIKDVLDESRDREMADHILTAHIVAGSHVAKKYSKELEEKEKRILPTIKPEFLRKYISYARKNIFPVLTEEASEKIKSFYVNLRKIGESQKSVPITARYIEAIIRLAEASAKVRMSQTVDIEDADKAIKLTTYCLKSIGVDPATGKLDIDILTTGTSRSKMDKTKTIVRIVKNLTSRFSEATHEEIIREAGVQGLKPEEAEEILQKLKREGELYVPKYGVYRPAEEK